MEYCAKLSEDELNTQNSSFGRESVSNLSTHIGNTHIFCIGEICMCKKMIYAEYASITNIEGLHLLFEKVDALLEFFQNDEDVDFNNVKQYQISGQSCSAPI